MISLIQNELTKIFKKKSIYITLLITLIFIIVINIIYVNSNSHYGYDPAQDVEFYESQIAMLQEDNSQSAQESISIYQSEIDSAKLIQKYGNTATWQANIIYNYIRANGFITTYQILNITKITTTAGASVALGRLMEAGLVKKVRQGRHFIYQLKN